MDPKEKSSGEVAPAAESPESTVEVIEDFDSERGLLAMLEGDLSQTNIGDEDVAGDSEDEGSDDEDSEDEDSDDEKPDNAWPKKVQDTFNKRVGKLTAKRKEAEALAESERARAAAAEARFAELQQSAKAEANVAPRTNHELMMAETMDEIKARESELWQLERWAAQNAGGFEGEINGKEVSLTSDQIALQLVDWREELHRIIPEAKATFNEREAKNAHARKLFPDLFVPGSDAARQVELFRKELPEVRSLPGEMMLMGYLLEGIRAVSTKKRVEKTEKASKKVAKVKRKAPKVGKPSGKRTRSSTSPDVDVEAKKVRQLEEGGFSEKDVISLLDY